MRQSLKLHPDSHSSAVTRVDVDVVRSRAGTLVLSYVVMGKIADLRIPPVTQAARTDELWQHTCFEAFVGPSAEPRYYEFNFAPSTQWSAYRFDGYRSGMRAATEINPPQIDVKSSRDWLILQAAVALDVMSGFAGGITWRLGLSAVIEEATGLKSYWALAHPPGKPDFHHSDCFAYELASA